MKLTVTFLLTLWLTCFDVQAQNTVDNNVVIVNGNVSVEIRNKKFNVWELRDLFAKEKWNNRMVWFFDCTFNYVPGYQNITTGFDDTVLEVPAELGALWFSNCTFNTVDLYVPGPTDVFLAECKRLNSLNFKNARIQAVLNTEIGRINSYIESGNINILVTGSRVDKLELSNATVNSLTLIKSQVAEIKLRNCVFRDTLFTATSYYLNEPEEDRLTLRQRPDSILLYSKDSAGMRDLTRGEAIDGYFHSPIYLGYSINNILLSDVVVNNFLVDHSTFVSKQSAVIPVHNSEVNYMKFSSSSMGTLDLFGTSIVKSFEFENSTIQGLNLFKASILSSNISGLTFDHLSGNKIMVFDPTSALAFSEPLRNSAVADSSLIVDIGWNSTSGHREIIDTLVFRRINVFNGRSATSVHNRLLFTELTTNYAKLYKIYKDREDIESANACYAEMKDLYTHQMKMEFGENPSFRNFFRWQLSNIVRIYTNHGTDPALAITISFWTIFFFAIFYFFFPSDWDQTSKKILLKNYQDFVQKNEKGYIKPFFTLTGGVLLSFLNALTLSLNAYTTLGFGNIPTHGIARYACVLQGFIGWFMLSIFSVALINQVLF